MEELKCWLVVILVGGVVVKAIWQFIIDLKKPSNDEVRDATRLESRLNELEHRQNRLELAIDKKVDNAVWLERSAKLEGFSKQHNVELTAVRKELNEVRALLMETMNK